ncbi:MAG: class II aldolase/adducin family protein, partial [Candidatus Omnitrophota bacterium]|nr:class II aldolase/adducin family protein [Candidatus Omnitrophota bacterium]
MDQEHIHELKRSIMAVGSLLWEKDLVSGLNGNISMRLDDQNILLTAHNSCLGLLQDKDILAMKLDGQLLEGGSVSTEKLLHTEIYKSFSETKAVIHTHTSYTNGYFLVNPVFSPQIFEAKIYLGEVISVPQTTPAVTDPQPVMDAFRKNNIVVLRQHGVVAKGKDLFDCFLLIQALEDAIKTDAVAKLYKSSVVSGQGSEGTKKREEENSKENNGKKYKLFSQEQINGIVEIVNADAKMKELGNQTKMNMDLAVKLDETGQVYSFSFRNGNIDRVSHDENAEFLVSAPAQVWRQVFNREIDPFVATTQKKMHLRGDFAKISKWYAPCSRVFELWAEVP